LTASQLKCTRCNKTFPLEDFYNCPSCGGILDVMYDFSKLSVKETLLRNEKDKIGIWQFQELLPLENCDNSVTLGEGDTPLIHSKTLKEQFGIGDLYLKDETRNPTGSFKDRAISVGLSKAKEENSEVVVVASSGNAGAAVSAYAAKSNLNAVVLTPEVTPLGKLTQIMSYGAQLIKVKGNFSQCFKLAKQASHELGWVNLTTTFVNPYHIEGDKTIAYEIAQQLGEVPDWVVVPTGAGPLIVGCYKGFNELQMLGITNKTPSMVAVQSEGCAPIAESFQRDKTEVSSWGKPTTVASGISDPLQGYSQDGTYTVKNIKKSKGRAITISDKSIVDGVFTLARKEGIFAEPAGASSIPAVEKLIQKKVIENTDTLVCLITGVGFKDIDSIRSSLDPPPTITSSTQQLKKVVKIN